MSYLKKNEHGLLNIVGFALILPILILFLVLASDIVRLPVAKTQLKEALSNAHRALKQEDQELSGQISCLMQPEKNRGYRNNCEPFPKNNSIAALERSLSFVLESLTKGGKGALAHQPDNISLKAALYLAKSDSNGKIKQWDLLWQQDGKNVGAKLSHPINLENELKNHLKPHKELKLANWLTQDKYIDVPVLVLSATVKVRNYFKLSGKLLSERLHQQKKTEDGLIISEFNLQPLTHPFSPK